MSAFHSDTSQSGYILLEYKELKSVSRAFVLNVNKLSGKLSQDCLDNWDWYPTQMRKIAADKWLQESKKKRECQRKKKSNKQKLKIFLLATFHASVIKYLTETT